MTSARTQLFSLAAAVTVAAPALAHHSIGMIDIASPAWVRATVVAYEPRDPHVLIHVQQRTADGETRPLTVEGPILNRLARMHLARDFLKAGDVIELCGFPFRKDVLASAPGGPASLPALHAQLLVLPDGRWQAWGPYGKLDNCMRATDDAATWSAFVNASPMGHEYWCKAMASVRTPSVAPKPLVDEVNRRLLVRCD